MGDVSWICEALFEYHLLSKTTYIHTYNTYPKILFEKKSQTKIHKLEIILEINVYRWVKILINDSREYKIIKKL